MPLAPAVAFALDRNERRRREGIATIDLLVGEGDAPRRAIEQWTSLQGCSIASPRGVLLADAARAWLATALEGSTPRRLLARHLARRFPFNERAIAAELDECGGDLPYKYAIEANRSPAFAAFCSAAVANTGSLDGFLERLAGSEAGLDRAPVHLLEVGFEMTENSSPTILFDERCLSPGTERTALETLTRIGEALPAFRTSYCTRELGLAQLSAGRSDEHVVALVIEGRLDVPSNVPASPSDVDDRRVEPAAEPAAGNIHDAARSEAERMLFQALERHPVTRGHFELNEKLPCLFGGRQAEVDLLDRSHGIAVEVDGYWHFSDLDAYRRDRRKDLLLQREGFIIVRALAEDVLSNVHHVVNEIARLANDIAAQGTL